ncbi:MAG: AAA family ATPase [Candidatus Poribacteria bacterium]|nr:AAA family ATPase [Candidatus Poribacteria bacterium]
MSLAEEIKALNLKNKDGLEKARHILIEYSRDGVISEIVNKIESLESLIDEFGTSPSDSDVIKDIDGLLKALFEYNIFLEPQSIVEITSWNDIKDVNREWLIPNWLPANTVTMFTGQGGAGKSWFTLQIICQIAGGFSEWAGLNPDVSSNADPNPTHNVVLATYEDEPAEIKRRLQALASGMSWINDSMDAIKNHLHIVDMRGVGSIWGPGMGNHIANTGDLLNTGVDLQHICEDKKARLLVIDPLSGAFGGNENDRTAVYDFISSLRKWGDDAKCAILVIGHLPKYAEGKNAGFSGSTAWEASVRSMWMLSKQEDSKDTGEYYALSHTKSNYAPLQAVIPLNKSINGWWQQVATIEEAVKGLKTYEDEIQSLSQENTDDDDPYKSISL